MKKLILLALLITVTFSCEDFEGWNVDTKNPSSIPADFLITSTERDLFLRMTSTSVNYNNFKLMAQQWTQTQYIDESNYDFRARDVGGTWSLYMYRDMLIDLQEAARLIDEDEFKDAPTKAVQMGTIEMLNVFIWSVLVDTFGNVPYYEALQGVDNLLPVYDDDAEIYADLFRRIDLALLSLSQGSTSFGDADLIYGGSTEHWMKFGNSLKLRMAVRIADADAATAGAKAKEAVAGGVFESNEDNAAFPFEASPPNTNPIWTSLVQSGRNDFVVCKTFVDLIVPLNDPRASVFMADNKVPYEGAVYGQGSSYVDYTHIGDLWHTPDFEAIILSYSEVEFLMAEAIEKGLVAGSAEDHYNNGVRASMNYWRPDLTDADIDGYLAQPSVAYATAGESWKEAIGIQKYLSLYGRGFEAWSSWRVLDYPDTFTRPEISMEAVPRRIQYGNEDPSTNGANYQSAAQAMGGDEKSSRVFWDVTGQGN